MVPGNSGKLLPPLGQKGPGEEMLNILDCIPVGTTADDGWRPGRSYKDGGLTTVRDMVQK